MNALGAENGAFSQYVRAYPALTMKIPESMSFEAAASLATGLSTAGLALFRSLQIPASLDQPPVREPFFVLVYGGSTATGTIAVQLLKMYENSCCSFMTAPSPESLLTLKSRCGIRAITTCSPRNFSLLKSYGAEEVFDYKSPTCAADIRAYTKNTLQYAFDCITEDDSMKICYGAIGRAGGRYTAVEPFPTRHKTRKAIRDEWILALTIYGKKVELEGVFGRDASTEDYEFGKKFFEEVEKILWEGRLICHPLVVGKGGFQGVVEGVDRIRHKAMSGQKMVYPVDCYEAKYQR